MSTASILLSQLRQKAGARLGLELPQSLLRPSVDFARWLPYTHPIMQTRGREVEERELELEIGVRVHNFVARHGLMRRSLRTLACADPRIVFLCNSPSQKQGHRRGQVPVRLPQQ